MISRVNQKFLNHHFLFSQHLTCKRWLVFFVFYLAFIANSQGQDMGNLDKDLGNVHPMTDFESVAYAPNRLLLFMGLSGHLFSGDISETFQFGGGVNLRMDYHIKDTWIIGTDMRIAFNQLADGIVPDTITNNVNAGQLGIYLSIGKQMGRFSLLLDGGYNQFSYGEQVEEDEERSIVFSEPAYGLGIRGVYEIFNTKAKSDVQIHGDGNRTFSIYQGMSFTLGYQQLFSEVEELRGGILEFGLLYYFCNHRINAYTLR